jgi:hypothetical protein
MFWANRTGGGFLVFHWRSYLINSGFIVKIRRRDAFRLLRFCGFKIKRHGVSECNEVILSMKVKAMFSIAWRICSYFHETKSKNCSFPDEKSRFCILRAGVLKECIPASCCVQRWWKVSGK